MRIYGIGAGAPVRRVAPQIVKNNNEQKTNENYNANVQKTANISFGDTVQKSNAGTWLKRAAFAFLGLGTATTTTSCWHYLSPEEGFAKIYDAHSVIHPYEGEYPKLYDVTVDPKTKKLKGTNGADSLKSYYDGRTYYLMSDTTPLINIGGSRQDDNVLTIGYYTPNREESKFGTKKPSGNDPILRVSSYTSEDVTGNFKEDSAYRNAVNIGRRHYQVIPQDHPIKNRTYCDITFPDNTFMPLEDGDVVAYRQGKELLIKNFKFQRVQQAIKDTAKIVKDMK